MAERPQRPLFYSTSEVAALLSCSGEHVRQLVRLGKLKAHDGLGRKLLIPCNEVARLTGTETPGGPGHEAVSSAQRSEVIRELRQKYAEIGMLLVRLEED